MTQYGMQADASPGSLHCWEYQLSSALCSTVKGSDVEMDKRRPESEEGYDTQRAAVRKAAEREAGASSTLGDSVVTTL